MAWHSGLPKKLKRRGVKVKVVRGWKKRGRFPFNPIGGMFHHTASNKKSGNAPALGLVTHGSSRTAPGPLANILGARDGTIYFVAAGRANHGGYGGPWGRIPRDSANAYLVGQEWENNGIGEKWSEEQLTAAAIFNELLLENLNRKSPNRVLPGHKEYAPKRKIDPAGVNMKAFRARVARLMKGPKPQPVVEPEPKPRPKPQPRPFRPIRKGNKGERVKTLQRRLKKVGHNIGKVDGDFGLKTERAVKQFQKKNRLKITGVVNEKTWKTLKQKA